MKKGFYLFFLVVLIFNSGCGQKGPLYLSEENRQTETNQVFDVGVEALSLGKPLLLELSPNLIRGQRAQLVEPLANDWNNLLNVSSERPLRYVVFESDILKDKTHRMLIGQIDETGGDIYIPKGFYLRFRESEARYVEIPKMLSAIRTFFIQNPNYKRTEDAVDFIMDEEGFIDIYIQIQLPSKKTGNSKQ